MATNALKLSTMVGEIFVSNRYKIPQIVHHGWRKKLKTTCLKWLQMPTNCPPWLEKMLKFTSLKWLQMLSNCPPWLENFLSQIATKSPKLSNMVGENFEIYLSQMAKNALNFF